MTDKQHFSPSAVPVTLVPTEISQRNVVASDAITSTNSALQNVIDIYNANASAWEPLNVDFALVDPVTDDFNVPDVPADPDIDFVIPDLPGDFVPTNIRSISIDDAPEFTAIEPVLANIGAPDDLVIADIEPGAAPDITTSYTFPTAPTITDPTLPTLSTITIPTADDISFPSFTQSLPDASTLVPPGLTFNFSEDSYNSTLHTAVATELLDRIQNGGTGLNANVELAIFNRGRDRELATSIVEEQQVVVEFQNGGWTIPTGVQTSAVRLARQKAQDRVSTINRDISIKQAELEQSNILAAIQSTIQYEGQLISLHDSAQGRVIQASLATQQFLIDIYNAEVTQFTQQVEVYKAFASAYEAQVRAEVAKITKFEAEIRAQQLILETDQASINLYLAQFEGTKNQIQNYTAQIQAINSQISAEGQRLVNYRTEVDAFSARIGAKGQEYANYSTRINGELAKVNVFDSKVKAYASRIEAYAAESEVQKIAVEADVEAEKVRLSQYQTKINSILALAQTKSQTFSQLVDEFRAKALLFEGQGRMEQSRIAAQNTTFEKSLQQQISANQLALEKARFDSTLLVQSAQTAVSLYTEEAKVQAQIAASAYAGTNLSAQVTYQGSVTNTETQRYNFEGTADS